MLMRLEAATIIVLALALPEFSAAQSCVQSGIAAGTEQDCAFAVGGSVMCWVHRPGAPSVPTVVTGVTPDGDPHSVGVGDTHACAIDGLTAAPMCWGSGDEGQLGDGRIGPNVFSATPVTVVSTDGAEIRASALAAGGEFSCAINEGGNVQCWGDNYNGELGDGSTDLARAKMHSFAQSILDAPALAISAGTSHACAVMRDHTARCWGSNLWGQIGNGVSGGDVRTPAPVMLGNNVVGISAGTNHTCALLSPNGTVECWGFGANGELGHGGTDNSALPVQVLDSSGQPLSGVQEIVAGQDHTCALMMTGPVQCWGISEISSQTPVTITDARGTPLSGVAHISAGNQTTCAALSAGGIQCWGADFFSDPPSSSIHFPFTIGGLCNCPGPIQYCNGRCTNTTTDAGNCGGCNIHCIRGTTCCNSQCVDTTTDPANCNGCNIACITGDICAASACKCQAPRTECPAPGPTHVCTDTSMDRKNCSQIGQCGHICPEGAICSNGTCVCPPGLTECGNRCVDLQTDNNNCGHCGRHCRNQQGCNREERGCTACENGECEPF